MRVEFKLTIEKDCWHEVLEEVAAFKKNAEIDLFNEIGEMRSRQEDVSGYFGDNYECHIELCKEDLNEIN